MHHPSPCTYFSGFLRRTKCLCVGRWLQYFGAEIPRSIISQLYIGVYLLQGFRLCSGIAIIQARHVRLHLPTRLFGPSGARPLNSWFPSNQLTETETLYGIFRLCLEVCFLHMVPNISVTNPLRKVSYPGKLFKVNHQLRDGRGGNPGTRAPYSPPQTRSRWQR